MANSCISDMNLILVGAGERGLPYADALSRLGVLAAVCDADEGSACAKNYSVPHYANVDEAIQHEEFDGAIVATPEDTHFEMASKLLDAKKHLFVEWPLTRDVTECDSLLHLAERRKIVLSCGHTDELYTREAGMIRQIASQAEHGSLVALGIYKRYGVPSGKDADTSTSSLLPSIIRDSLMHDVDIANSLYGDAPTAVFMRVGNIRHGNVTKRGTSSVTLGYGNGRLATFLSNWVTPGPILRLEASFENASVVWNMLDGSVNVEGTDCKVEPDNCSVSDDDDSSIQNRNTDRISTTLQDFLDDIRHKKHGTTGARHALATAKIAEAALLSDKRGIPIYLDLR